jgi:hypothetical protein
MQKAKGHIKARPPQKGGRASSSIDEAAEKD